MITIYLGSGRKLVVIDWFFSFSSSDSEEWLSNAAKYSRHWGRERRADYLALDMQSAEAGKRKAVSNFIKKIWTAFEQGIRKIPKCNFIANFPCLHVCGIT